MDIQKRNNDKEIYAPLKNVTDHMIENLESLLRKSQPK